MSRDEHEHISSPDSNEKRPVFTDKIRDLLPTIEFEESAEMLEARIALTEALTMSDQDPKLLQLAWVEYARVCEQLVDSKTPADTAPHIRAQLQIATLIHKALIFREVGNIQRYAEDLINTRVYAFNVYLDEIVHAIDIELDSLGD